ncbi:bifunctional diaminohydroxyphosphoribosylaminopyrimidine deaminase/5-amino-6-(5-phosphoribosylamino)uracil reductase RibD [Levilactobacillus acidifarinae]|uniref:Riboflavin biosynthesis protein RibD n=1 Tax=Levilactobacillus acidifarinae DSM 19394 = JCM 15949 TaxID=1423715 RepID=A0A0R1LKF8_9LACO|nr:bifunctional diaminohydroxyphosphoribosylaminopyrimidine deaminase/5-amino-6-(5-phosphoribosylamino)uracil reductase RibD [Levilactobacillus acidifarinae]KRK96056.1 pyrimidine reductase, riboflavin biosynthesis [Levilactobacillus acidifarinae DSM 19394]GEO69670.1 riboflavin biosynthesis protein RibD [Levilactobacillus acidifarinae]
MTDQDYLDLAVAQARRGTGQTWTNPLVGAVLVKDGQILAKGYHHRFGQDHAEVNALKQLADERQARGTTLYVTLEPCSHYGKTPPCARKLVTVGVTRVVIGQRDPNPLVSGKGIAILRAAGIAVTVLETTKALNPAYNFFYHHHRPLVTLKMAVSVDGKLNATTGQRTELTGPEANHDSQRLRATQQAILIGERTLTVDQPALTVRETTVAVPPRRVVVVNAADKLDRDNRLFQTPEPVWLLSRQPSHQPWPASVTVVAGRPWTPDQIVQYLAEQGLQSLLVEGGSHLHAQFVAAGVVDRVVTYVAPLLLGGQALPAVLGPASQRLTLSLTGVQPLGADVRLTFRRRG